VYTDAVKKPVRKKQKQKEEDSDTEKRICGVVSTSAALCMTSSATSSQYGFFSFALSGAACVPAADNPASQGG
jgi:hypothetical protein